MKAEFCLNSNRYIEFMAYKGRPPMTCPRREDNFLTCETCSYYQNREPSKHYKKIKKAINEVWK